MTLDKNLLFNLVLAFLIYLTVPCFSALGETRIDVYISMFILEYFICLALFRPRRRVRDVLAYVLFIVFSVIVAIKVIEILFG